MMRILAIIMLAAVAAAAPATNRVAAVRVDTNRVQILRGQPVAKSLLKTQPSKSLRVKDAAGKTVDLPLMFDNNRLSKIKKAKDKKESKK